MNNSLVELLRNKLISDLINKGEDQVIIQLGGEENYNELMNYIIRETEKNETVSDLIQELKCSVNRLKAYENKKYN